MLSRKRQTITGTTGESAPGFHLAAGVVRKGYPSPSAVAITITVMAWRTMGKSERFLVDPSSLAEGTEHRPQVLPLLP